VNEKSNSFKLEIFGELQNNSILMAIAKGEL